MDKANNHEKIDDGDSKLTDEDLSIILNNEDTKTMQVGKFK